MQRRFGQYRLLERIGTGGMAEVYRGRREGQIFFSRRLSRRKFSREVAVKLILPHLSREETFRELFSREAHLASLLNHPNIIDIQDYGRLENVDFIVMEYVKGADLRRLLKGFPRGEKLPLAESIHLLYRVTRGLAFAHGQTDPVDAPEGIIHCDLSPHNILISTEGEIKIADFGIARAVRPDSTRTGTLRGKAPYMSPEQAEGQPLDHRSDLFSLGSIAYQLFTGRHPFTRGSDAAILSAVREALYEPLTAGVGLPDPLVELVHSLLEKDSGHRPEDASIVAKALEIYLEPHSEMDLANRIRDVVESTGGGRQSLPTAVTLPRPKGFRMPAYAGILLTIAAAVWLLTQPVVKDMGNHYRMGESVINAPDSTAGREDLTANKSGREASGYLTIRTDPPGAQIMLDGRAIGPSPIRIAPEDLEGEPSIEASLYGFRGERRRLERGTRPEELTINLTPLPTAMIRIGAIPWAEVFYRGSSIGYTPLTRKGIPVGHRTFTLRNEPMGLSHEVTIEVRQGGPNIINENLRDSKGIQ